MPNIQLKHLLRLAATLSIIILSNPSYTEPKNDLKRELDLSLFMLGNFLDESPEYAHLGLATDLNSKDAVGLEFITWKYSAPLGIPYGSNLGNPDEYYPGNIRDIGIGMTYKRVLVKGLFAKFHATPLLQTYTDLEGNRLQQGFQLFTVARLGYRWTLARDRIYIEPSFAATSWPIRTNVPASFKTLDNQWPDYFLFEPGLNIGFRF